MKVKIKRTENEIEEMYSTSGNHGHGHPKVSPEDEHAGHVERSRHQGLRNVTTEDVEAMIGEELQATINEKIKGVDGKACWKGYKYTGTENGKDKCVKMEEEEKPCKPSKGKRFAKRVDGKCRSFGQKGQAKGGGDRIRPGTKKGDAYCARSAKIKKCKNPPCANALSRKKWKCQGSKSVAEE